MRELMISTTIFVSLPSGIWSLPRAPKNPNSHIQGGRGEEQLTSGLQTRSTDQEPVDVLLLRQLTAVLLRHGPAVDDARALRRLGRDAFLQPGADGSVDFLRLLRRRDFARADGPVVRIGELDMRRTRRRRGRRRREGEEKRRQRRTVVMVSIQERGLKG